MNFLCDKGAINAAISQAAKILPAKAIIPAYEGILIEAEGDECKLTVSDSKLTLNICFKADVKESGNVLVPGKIFIDIIRRCYDGDIEISTDSDMNIKSGNLNVNIALSVENYPKLFLEGDKKSFKMDIKEFKDGVHGTVFCAADENYMNPVYTGVYITKEEDKIKFVSLDGYRVAVKNVSASGEDATVLVPAKSLDEISKTFGEEGEVLFTIYNNYIVAVWEDITLISVLLEKEEFSDYKGFLPKSNKTRIKVERSRLISSIDRAATISRTKKSNLIVLSIEDGVMSLNAKSDIGEMNDSLEVYQEGEPIRIGFNSQFLLDSIRSINDESFYIDFDGQVIPCVMKPCEGDNYLYMILPMQI
ncbi:MAG: DNA polymerase III subunit beta [Clostridia bacterium]|nr:DNA polymerase III subunit beta [Clostridia bacterium]